MIQFWKDYKIHDLIKNPASSCGDVAKECVNGIWEEDTEVVPP